jgi:AraC family transcriptional regulator
MSTPVRSVTWQELFPDAAREQFGPFPGQAAFHASRPLALLHGSASSGWRGAGLTHLRASKGTEIELAFSWIRISQRLSLQGGPFPTRAGERALPASSNLQIGIPGSVYRGTFTGPAEGLNLYVDPSLIERTLHAPYSEPVLADVARKLHRDRVIEHLMRALLSDVAAGSPGGPLLGEAVVAAIIHRLQAAERAPMIAKGAHLSAREMGRLRDFVAANLSRPVHLEDLATLLRMSVSRLSRAFRNTVGMSPHQYVLRLRAEHAQELLRQPGRSLHEVAEACGFADRTHLSTSLCRLLGRTPSQIRTNARESGPA